MELNMHIDSLLPALFFAAVFVFGALVRLPPAIARHRRSAMSFSGGIAVAYVFVRLLPELAEASEVFVHKTAHRALPFAESRVYLAAMLGFILFYGLEKLVTGFEDEEREERSSPSPALALHVGGFSIYVWLVSYLGVHGVEEGIGPILLYAAALGCHFLATDHALRREYGEAYDRRGRFGLATAALAGGATGVLLVLPAPLVITLLGLVSGGVIMNSMLGEVPREKDGRFWPFVAGCSVYAGILLTVG